MHILSKSITRAERKPSILPGLYQALTDKTASIRRGEVSMIAGPSGVGKSTLALAIALRAKVGTLYFSADTHEHTMSMRIAAALTDIDQSQVEPMLMADPEWAAQVLAAADHIRWCWNSSPSMRDIDLHLEAYVEAMGASPELVVLDNLIDVATQGDNEFQAHIQVLLDLKWVARKHSCSFIVLHHTNRAVGNPCPPLESLRGNLSQTPALVLTVDNSTDGFLAVGVVKNRYGRARRDGSDPAWLMYDPGRMSITDVERR